jgi:hypothetical protein
MGHIKMKRSKGVQLVLLGSAMGLYGCDGVQQTLQQQKYASYDQCRRDWGSPQDCRQTSASSGPIYYVGPRYFWDPNLGRPIAVEADGSTRSINNAHITSAGSESGGVTSRAGSFSRGGFGSSARGFGGGG